MKVAFHFVIPEPPDPARDGAVQEALWLQEEVGGHLYFHYPLRKFFRLFPLRWSGMHRPLRLRSLDREVDLHHAFLPDGFQFPFLKLLSKPKIVSIQTRLSPAQASRGLPADVAALAVADQRDVTAFGGCSSGRVSWIPPGLALERLRVGPVQDTDIHGTDIHDTEIQSADRFVVVAGSAPWTRRQIETKGLHSLLAAAEAIPELRLVLLLRGSLEKEIASLVERRGLEQRVELLPERVDVPQLLARCHAVVALSASSHLLKAFPHSVLEGLAAGRPALVSHQLGIADLISTTGSGICVPGVAVAEVTASLRRLMAEYESFAAHARRLDLNRFSRQRFLSDYQDLYRKALAS